MSFDVTFYSARVMKALTVTLVLLAFWPTSDTFAQDAREIEFSEPRGAESSSTKSNALGSEKRSLSNLEDRLSKTFDFFQLEDSLGGSPAFRLPPKVPAAPQRSNKPSGRSLGKREWLSDEALINLPGLEEDPLGFESPSNREENDQSGSPLRSTLLDSMRGDDWLVRGTLGETFWELPVLDNNMAAEGSLSRLPDRFGEETGFESTDEWLVTQMGGFMNEHPETTPVFETPDGMNANNRRLDVYDFSQDLRKSASEERREQYRDLLGLNAKSVPDPAPLAPLDRSGQSSFGSYHSYMPAASVGMTDTLPRGGSANSLYPVRSADRSSIYQSSPYRSQEPNPIDVLEVEQPAASAFAPNTRVSSPLYQPLRRQF